MHSAVLPDARQTYTFDGMQRKTRSKREREREMDRERERDGERERGREREIQGPEKCDVMCFMCQFVLGISLDDLLGLWP